MDSSRRRRRRPCHDIFHRLLVLTQWVSYAGALCRETCLQGSILHNSQQGSVNLVRGIPMYKYPRSLSPTLSSLLPLTRLHANNQDSTEDLLDLESPLSHDYRDDEDGLSPPLSSLYGRDPSALTKVTDQFLHDADLLGKLSSDDIETMTGLMAAWARKRSAQAALMVEALLKRIIDDLKAGNTDVHVRTQHYTLTLDAWSKSNAPGASERAQQIHDTMTREFEQTGNIDIRPNVLSCTTLATAWAKSNSTDACKMSYRVLKNMITAYKNGEKHMKPDAVTFSTVMDAFSRSPDIPGPEACRQCEELFCLMDRLGVRKNVYTFSSLQNAYARSGLPNAMQRNLEILEHMEKLHQDGDVFAKPNVHNYNAALNAAFRTGTVTAAKQAQELLGKLERPVNEGGFDVEPDTVSYTLVILAWSRVPDRMLAAKMSLAALEQMERKANQEEERQKQVSSAAPPVVHLDFECFNVVLNALSRSGDEPESSQQIRKILQRMNHYGANGHPQVSPTVRSWNMLLNSLARYRKFDTATTAHKVLRQMLRLHSDGVANVLPDAFSFAAVLTAYQRVATVAAANAADALVTEMEELYDAGEIADPPDVYHYTILAGVWAKSEQGKKGADKSVDILARMIERHKAGFPGVKPNVRTYNAVLDCLARADDGDRVEGLLYHMLSLYNQGEESAKPDSFSFNCAIAAFTRSKKKDSGRRAEAILERFLEYQETENPLAVPDARSFTNIIAHYGRSRWLVGTGSSAIDGPYRAEYILNRMVALFKDGRLYLEPNNFAVSTVMESYSFAKHPDAGPNAERLLRLTKTLIENHGATKLSINTSLINSVLFAWSSSGDANAGNRALAHVDYLEAEYARGNQELRPDNRSYGYLLSAISKSTGQGKAQRALEVINRMKDQRKLGNQALVIDEHHYSLAINACGFSNADIDSEVEAFQIAIKLFDEVVGSSELTPSSLTFGWFIQSCGRLRAPDALRSLYIERSFRLCCKQGLVNDFVLRRLIGAAQEDLLRKLLQEVNVDGPYYKSARIYVSMLPESWTRSYKRKP